MKTNILYHGDNLKIMKKLESGKIDLIYIDPPFNSGQVLKNKSISFKDKFDSTNSYIHWLKPRLRECHRLLKETGSLFIHLDWRMSHYIKVELDKIFGVKNPCLNPSYFKNEIIWHYGGPARLTNRFPQKHDSILFYSKSKKDNKFYQQYDDIPPYAYKRARKDQNGRLWIDQRLGVKGQTLKRLRKEKRTFKTKTGGERLKQYLDEMKGKPLSNVWFLPIINSQSKERTGWPTQKPLALLERIIKATTKKGDLVADFFCGCGTAIVAAQNLGRRWLAVDISKDAINLVKERMIKEHDLIIKTLKI